MNKEMNKSPEERLRYEIRANALPYCFYKEPCNYKLAGNSSGKHIKCGMYPHLCNQQRWDLEHDERGANNRGEGTKWGVNKE